MIFFFSLRSYLDKTVALHLNKNRKVTGTLRGYDQFMNLVLGNAVEEASNNQRNNIGMVVSLPSCSLSLSLCQDMMFCFSFVLSVSACLSASAWSAVSLFCQVVRGNSIVQVSSLSPHSVLTRPLTDCAAAVVVVCLAVADGLLGGMTAW